MPNNSNEIDGLMTGDSGDPQQQGINFFDLWISIREKAWLLVLTTILGLAIAWAVIQQSTEIYRATAVVKLEMSEQRIVNVQGVETENLRYADMVNTFIISMTGSDLLERVAESLSLNEDPKFLPPKADGSQRSLGEAIGKLRRGARASLRENTRLVNVSFEHENPDVARRVADAMCEEFIRMGFDKKAQANRLANQFLIQEAENLRNKLRQAEEALQSYIEREDALSLEDRYDTVTGLYQSLNGQLNAAKSKLRQLEIDYKKAQASDGNVAALKNLPSVQNHPAVAGLNQRIAKLEQDMFLLQQRYKEKHPKYIALQSMIDESKGRVDETILQAARDLESQFAQTVEEVESLTAALAAQEVEAKELNRKSIEYNNLRRDVETEQSLYEAVLARVKELDLTEGISSSPVTIYEQAAASGRPVRPDKQQILISGGFGGLAFGLAIVLLLFFLDTSIRTVDQAEGITGHSVLAAIPLQKSGKKLAANEENMAGYQIKEIWDTKYSPLAEAFRSMRASVKLLGKSSERRVSLFTSSMPGEGKTYVSSNYAVSLAQQEEQTLLIDGDLRKPNVAPAFLGDNRTPGVTDILLEEATIDDAIIQSDYEHLHILPAGTVVPKPGELLSGKGLGTIVSEALLRYSRVVIDTAPIIAVSDTLLLLELTNVVCLVIRSGKTPRKVVNRAIKAIEDTGTRLDGLILNQLPMGKRGYYYYYYSGQYTGSDQVYGQEVLDELENTKA